MKLSVILPCRDRAENTKALMNKLAKQKTPQVEIVVVDNCSKEDMSFLKDYDIRLLYEENEGVSFARNKGLENAAGDYICWIDNDDDISDDYVETILSEIDSGYDWYIFQRERDGRVFTLEDIDLKNPTKVTWALWGYCISRKLWEGKRFDTERKVGEDYILFDILPNTNGKLIRKVLYHYRWKDNDDSLCHRHNRGEL